MSREAQVSFNQDLNTTDDGDAKIWAGSALHMFTTPISKLDT